MNAPAFKTRSEQRLEQLEHVGRPLTEAESNDLQRALHAVYCRNRKLRIIQEEHGHVLEKYDAENAALLAKVLSERRGR